MALHVLKSLPLLGLVVIGALVASAAPAAASYKVCNETSYVLDSAIAYRGEDDWVSKGWVRVLPGTCMPIIDEPLDRRSYYIYATSIDAHAGPRRSFAGLETFCTARRDFEIFGREDCALRGYAAREFSEVRVDLGATSWTTTFAEPTAYTLKLARTAGAQRLLEDNGYEIGQLDGYMGHKTRRAIVKFQQKAGLSASGAVTDSLYDALIDAGIKRQQGIGLNICNQTDHIVWSAIGRQVEEVWTSSGWYLVEPGACTKAIKEPLAQTSYYIYSEAPLEDGTVLTWGGETPFCTKNTKFEIGETGNCKNRGYDQSNFKLIDLAAAEPLEPAPEDADGAEDGEEGEDGEGEAPRRTGWTEVIRLPAGG